MANTSDNKLVKQVFKFSPAQILVMGFASIILVGTVLLSLPVCGPNGHAPKVVDALFTATSAVCVTGLVVVDTAKDFSFFGQIIILLLIQLGGLGYMTLATLTALFIGKKITLRDRILMQEGFNQFDLSGLVQFTLYVVKVTLLFELIGALILTWHWMGTFGLSRAFYLGIFHCVSAFCNAGFSLFSANLAGYVIDPVVNLVITSLIIIGGIGYVVISDIYMYRRTRRLLTHTKFVLSITAGLIFFGTLILFLLEKDNPFTLGNLDIGGKLLASYFQAVTARTSGFNTVDIGSIHEIGLFLLVILMFIGASPGGTGGGIKTTTFGTVMLEIWATLRGKMEVNVFKRKLPAATIRKAFALTFLSAILVTVVTIILLIIEKQDFIRVLFEVTSAFGTVGLSAGKGMYLSLSSLFSTAGKLLIVLTMFAGRVGPLTLGVAVIQESEQLHYKNAKARVLIG
jgi:trk system potassium uptake protein